MAPMDTTSLWTLRTPTMMVINRHGDTLDGTLNADIPLIVTISKVPIVIHVIKIKAIYGKETIIVNVI